MSGSTTNGFPYPTPDDPLIQYPTQAQALAQAVDDALNVDLGEWQDWTNTRVDQGAATFIAHTVDYARYCRIGHTMHVMASLTFTGAGTAGSAIACTNLPNMSSLIMNKGVILGSFRYIDGTVHYQGIAVGGSGANLTMLEANTRLTVGINPNLGIASGDRLQFNLTYPAA